MSEQKKDSREAFDDSLTEPEREKLRRIVDRTGEGPFAITASVARGTVARALAGLPVRRGSLMLIRMALEGAASG